MSASFREAWGGVGCLFVLSFVFLVFNKLAKLTSLRLWLLLLDHTEYGRDCLLDLVSSPTQLQGTY